MKKFYVFVSLLCGIFLFAAVPLSVTYAANVGYTPSNEYKNSVYYQNLLRVNLTGDMRTDIVNIAKSQVGYHEGNSESEYGGDSVDADGDYTEYGYWYCNNVKHWQSLKNSAWCAMFVSWCARQANISADIIANSINAIPDNTTGNRDDVGRYFYVEEKTPESGYVPLPGDLIFFDWTGKDKNWSHVGIVCYVMDDVLDDIKGRTVITVEGNSANKVAMRAYAFDDPVIRAYGVPNYAVSDVHSHTWKTVDKTSCTKHGTKRCLTCGAVEDIEQIDHQYWHWGEVVTDEDKVKHKHTDKPATCTADGEKSFCCIRCSERAEIEIIPAKGHDYRVLNKIEPTCKHTGTVYYICNNDSTHVYNEEIDKLSHEESDWIIDKEATYFEDGKRHTECTVCKTVMREESIPKLTDSTEPNGRIEVNGFASDKLQIGDTTAFYRNNKVEFFISASDDESGIKEISYFVSEKLLNNIENVSEITEWVVGDSGFIEDDGKYVIYVRITDNAGNRKYISSSCFEIDTERPKISGVSDDQTYCSSVKFTVNEACIVSVDSNVLYKNTQGYYVVDGVGKHSVSVTDRAGNSVMITITVNEGHTHGEFTEEIQPTCTTPGKKVMYCTVCNCILKTETVQALGHDAGKWETVKNGTCTEDGIRQRICTRCNGTIEKVVDKAQGHILSQWTTQKQATCTRDGKEVRYCLTCGEITEENVVPSHGHILSDWVIITDATCTEDGKAVKYCTVCHEHIREQLIQSSGHEVGDWVKEYEPTCTQEGHNVKLCPKCEAVIEEEYVKASGHRLSYGKCVVCGYSTPLRWIIIGTAVAGMLAYVTFTIVQDIRRKRRG